MHEVIDFIDTKKISGVADNYEWKTKKCNRQTHTKKVKAKIMKIPEVTFNPLVWIKSLKVKIKLLLGLRLKPPSFDQPKAYSSFTISQFDEMKGILSKWQKARLIRNQDWLLQNCQLGNPTAMKLM